MDRMELLEKLESDLDKFRFCYGNACVRIESKVTGFERNHKVKLYEDCDDERTIDEYPVIHIEGGKVELLDNCKVKKADDNEYVTRYVLEYSIDNIRIDRIGCIELVKRDFFAEAEEMMDEYNESNLY